MPLIYLATAMVGQTVLEWIPARRARMTDQLFRIQPRKLSFRLLH
jgi:hypothetical protein